MSALRGTPLFRVVLTLLVAQSATGLLLAVLTGAKRLTLVTVHLWIARALMPPLAVLLWRHLQGRTSRRVLGYFFAYWVSLFVAKFTAGNTMFFVAPFSALVLWRIVANLMPWLRDVGRARAASSIALLITLQVAIASALGTHLDTLLLGRHLMPREGVFTLNFYALHQWAGLLVPFAFAGHLASTRASVAPPVIEWMARVRPSHALGLIAATLTAVLVWNWRASDFATYRPDAYVPLERSSVDESDFCGRCHEDEHRQWLVSLHRFAASNDLYRASLAVAERRHGREAVAFCAPCHEPFAAVGAVVRGSSATEGASRATGLDCIVCHRVIETPDPLANGSLRYGMLPTARDVRGGPVAAQERMIQSIAADTREHRRDMNPVDADWRVCASCHRLVLPPAPERKGVSITVEDTVTTWLEGPFGRTSTDCRSCHMPRLKVLEWERAEGRPFSHPHHSVFGLNQALALMQTSAEPAALASRDRTTIELLSGFPGLTGLQKYAQLSHGSTDPFFDENRRRVGGALAIALSARPLGGDQFELCASTTNAHAGHALPAGPADLNELWLSVVLVDQAGRSHAVIGAVGAGGERDPHAPSLGATWLDGDGQPMTDHDLLSLSAVVDERRILPGATRLDCVTVRTPDGVDGLVRLQASWNYRRVSPSASRVLLDEARPFPITSIGSGELGIRLPLIAATEHAAPPRPPPPDESPRS